MATRSYKRGNGEGSLTQRPDGRWMARFYITLPSGERRRQHITLKDRDEVMRRMRDEMAKSGVKIVAGDTKVVPKGGVDGLFINTAGIGEIMREGISAHRLEEDDAIIVSNEVGNHGARTVRHNA